jgi:hypothetical protein
LGWADTVDLTFRVAGSGCCGICCSCCYSGEGLFNAVFDGGKKGGSARRWGEVVGQGRRWGKEVGQERRWGKEDAVGCRDSEKSFVGLGKDK